MLAKQEHERIAAKLANGSMPRDEPLFTLRAQDQFAATAVRFWADLVDVNGSPPEEAEEAHALANLMDKWPIKEVPGRPGKRYLNVREIEERRFRHRLTRDRSGTIRELMAHKVDEWMEDGTTEIARVLTNWCMDGLDLKNDDTIVALAEGRLWDANPL